MYAIISDFNVAPGNEAAYAEASEEFTTVRAPQPGFHGAITLAAGDGHRLGVNLWAAREAQQAAQSAIAPALDRLRALFVAPWQARGAGEVVRDTSAPGATYATLSQVVYAPGQQEAGQVQADEYQTLVDQQPGACGGIFIAIGGGQQLILRLWTSAAQQEASAQVRQAAFDRLVAPWQAAPLQLLGKGPIVRDTFTQAR